MQHPNLHLVIILLAVAVLAVAILRRARLPAVLAYLFTGILVGPHVLSWIPDAEDTRVLAEYGVVFLLFTLGLEFSLPRLLVMKREVLVLGGAQVLITILGTSLVASQLGAPVEIAFVLGAAFAMSSTAIVVKQLVEQTEINLSHGRLAVAVLLFQDMAVIPLLILIPALKPGTNAAVLTDLAIAFGKGALALAVILAAGRWLLRPLFHEIAAAHSAELFTLAVLLFTLSSAWITADLGMSLALGAFLAGMMLAETEFRHQVEADIRPFRDVLLGLFFVTVGMLVNPVLVYQQAGWILLVVIGLMTFKALTIGLLSRLLGTDKAMAFRTGLVLSQGGEFGFALLALGLGAGVIDERLAQFALAVIVLSMVAGPLLIRTNSFLARRLFPDGTQTERDVLEHDVARHSITADQHVIIAGYGRVGQNVARFLEQEGFSYIALDLDPVRVKTAREAGDPVYFGDASHLDILRTAGVDRAVALVISYYDVSTAIKILDQVRKIRLDLPVLVRTRDDSSLDVLQQAGATEVIPETLEASLMVASHLLALLRVPTGRIIRRIQEVRSNRYSLLRNVFRGQDALPMDDTHAFRGQLYTVTIPAGAYAQDKRIVDLALDSAGVTVTALRRDGIVGKQPDAETVLREGDVLVLYGTPEDLEFGENHILKG